MTVAGTRASLAGSRQTREATAATSGSAGHCVSTEDTAGIPDPAHGLSTPARSFSITSAGPPSRRSRPSSGSAPAVADAADDERRADRTRLPEHAEPDLSADPAGTREHRVEGHDGRTLLARHDLVQIGGAHRAGHTRRAHDEEQGGQGHPERARRAPSRSRRTSRPRRRRGGASFAGRSSARRSARSGCRRSSRARHRQRRIRRSRPRRCRGARGGTAAMRRSPT